MGLYIDNINIPSTSNIYVDGTALTTCRYNDIIVWRKSISGFTGFSLSKGSNSIWSGNSGHSYTSSHSESVSGRTLSIVLHYVSQAGGSLSASSGVIDVSGYKRAVFNITRTDGTCTVGFVNGPIASTNSSGNVTVNFSGLSSVRIYANCAIGINSSTMITDSYFGFTINSITFS